MLRNFLHIGEPCKRKFITVAWNNVIKPLPEDRLGIKRLREINMTLLRRLAFTFLSGVDDFLAHKFLNKNGDLVKRYRSSCIWKKISTALIHFEYKVLWTVGPGSKIDMWRKNSSGNKAITHG